MNLVFKVSSADDMIKFGEILSKYMYRNLVITLNGDLGAGKTTFTKGIGISLDVERVINSPTFTIMKVYESRNKLNGIDKLYHLDVYRLNDASGDFELEEYFEQNGVSVIEWADIIKDILPEKRWNINILDIGDNKRRVELDLCDELPNLISDLRGENYEIID